MLVSVPVLVWSSLRYGKRSRPAFLALRDRVADTMSSLQEGLAGVRVVQSFGQETDRYASYRERSSAQVSAWRRISLVNIGFFPVIAFAQSLALAAVLVAGGYLERHGRVTVGTIVAFALYLISLFDPIARLGDWFSEFQSGRAALAKIVDAPRRAGHRARRRGGSCPSTGALIVEDASFAYGGRRAGGRRRLAPDRGRRAAGARRCDGRRQVDARQAARARLRPGRRPRLASAASTSARAARRSAPAHRLRAAGGPSVLRDDRRQHPARAPGRDRRGACGRRCGRSARWSDSRASPDGLATDVRSRGVRLSSGERQLVSLARVALADPAVIVLDEATSSLDPQTEAAVEQALAVLSRRGGRWSRSRTGSRRPSAPTAWR